MEDRSSRLHRCPRRTPQPIVRRSCTCGGRSGSARWRSALGSGSRPRRCTRCCVAAGSTGSPTSTGPPESRSAATNTTTPAPCCTSTSRSWATSPTRRWRYVPPPSCAREPGSSAHCSCSRPAGLPIRLRTSAADQPEDGCGAGDRAAARRLRLGRGSARRSVVRRSPGRRGQLHAGGDRRRADPPGPGAHRRRPAARRQLRLLRRPGPGRPAHRGRRPRHLPLRDAGRPVRRPVQRLSELRRPAGDHRRPGRRRVRRLLDRLQPLPRRRARRPGADARRPRRRGDRARGHLPHAGGEHRAADPRRRWDRRRARRRHVQPQRRAAARRRGVVGRRRRRPRRDADARGRGPRPRRRCRGRRREPALLPRVRQRPDPGAGGGGPGPAGLTGHRPRPRPPRPRRPAVPAGRRRVGGARARQPHRRALHPRLSDRGLRPGPVHLHPRPGRAVRRHDGGSRAVADRARGRRRDGAACRCRRPRRA